MKKFIAAFDGLRFSESTIEYAIFLAKQVKAHLVGVFMEDFMRHSYGIAEITQYAGEDFDRHVQELDQKDKEEQLESVHKFEQACHNVGLNYTVHRNKNLAIHELLHESIYADMIIIGKGETLTRYDEESPSRFMRELLNEVQCPVLVVPEKYKAFEKIVLLYDGEPSSVYAVRMFSYILEEFKHLETQVLTVKSSEESMHLPDTRLMKEFIKRHYPKAEYVVLKGPAEDEIIRYLHREKKEPIVVLGAYQRSKLSRLFRLSMADYLLQHLKMPLFIAHNKS